jgi:hypothetical protein
MTLKQAVKRLAALGFKMEDGTGCVRGLIGAEAFNAFPINILSTPMRDVFVGQTSKGWQVTSYINFQGRHIREKTTHLATILNIMGNGATLDEAMDDFVDRFNKKIYSGSRAKASEGVPTGLKRLVGPIL